MPVCLSASFRQKFKLVLVGLLIPGTMFLLYFTYSPTWWTKERERIVYPVAIVTQKKPAPVISSTTLSQNTTKPEPVLEDPGPYHVAYPRKYRFVIDQPDVCEQQKPFVVVIVPVPPGNAEARDAIRKTWGGEKVIGDKVLLVLFLMGSPSGADEVLQERLRNESQQHRDLLQSDFHDSYRNLTIKTMVMMEWISTRCPQASYGVKVDADVLLEMKNLMMMLTGLNTAQTNYMTGLVWYGNIVIRDENNKFFLPYDVYPQSVYPPYPLGMCYIFSTDLPVKFLQESKQIKAIFIEDVYLGLIMERLGIVPTNPPDLAQFVVNPPAYDRCHFSRLIAIHTANSNQMQSFWTDIHSTSTPC